MLSSKLEEISIEEINQLIESGSPEKKQLEFKRELDPNNSKHKKKFLAEVTSFANTKGGDLLIGIPDPKDIEKEDDKEICWITDYERDDYKLRWEGIIENNTQQSLNTHDIRTIENPEDDGFIAIVRVRQSSLSPHRVTLRSKKPFYARNSGGKYELDVEQLREQFIEQYQLKEEIEGFLANRISKIRSGDTPAPFETGPCMALHIIPATAFTLQSEIQITEESDDITPNPSRGLPLLARNNEYNGARRNVDGLVNSKNVGNFRLGSNTNERWYDYVQIFRDGCIEAVNTFYFRKEQEDQIGFKTLYQIFMKRLPQYSKFLFERDVGVPIFFYLTFLETEGFTISISNRNDSRELDRNIATLPPITLESEKTTKKDLTKELMREIWYAFGEFEDPFNYYQED